MVSPARGRACSTALRTWRAAGSHNRDASAQIAVAGLQQKQGVFQVCALFHSIITFTANSAASRCQRRGTTSVTQLVQLQVTGKLVIRRAALIHTSPPSTHTLPSLSHTLYSTETTLFPSILVRSTCSMATPFSPAQLAAFHRNTDVDGVGCPSKTESLRRQVLRRNANRARSLESAKATHRAAAGAALTKSELAAVKAVAAAAVALAAGADATRRASRGHVEHLPGGHYEDDDEHGSFEARLDVEIATSIATVVAQLKAGDVASQEDRVDCRPRRSSLAARQRHDAARC